ncbi:zinc finger protein 675-like [Plodia interpunctella]|uniref:zinc finger protein 675-like n=1 Tax=Plodia interpunctella TaxID=58824 RepID=UPI002368E0ED|nr:zinc finger protein 675-like [Plodia interpunctella]XP_053609719.1 zinc finger protein 675-like [Plodia interpunctella]XP_053609720.1 zinc finger protein 675-like [Plodia interpunctella]XP_053609721.1 zinc finger protein 675-like [Plodia interpunctella]XP_053609722.1 zinc finger protein 675-like [Plodia interpunctella]XP_053609723.1 zinc finger protein 675-like [Plodia interpunctella]
MESKDEIITFYGRCRCCLEYGYMKSIWKEHIWEDEKEIYGEMLMETFNIAWESNDVVEYICDTCVTRLRDAFHFKKEIISADLLLEEGFEEGMELVNLEKIASKTEEDNENLEEFISPDIEVKTEYGEIEYLEEDADIVEQSVYKIVTDATKSASDNKWPNKKKKCERSSYRNYTQADLKRCVEMIQKEGISQLQAAKIFNIPTKTVNAKMCSLRSESPIDETRQEKRERTEKQIKFVEEIQAILEMTNSMPFKVKSTKLYCAYCYMKGDYYEDTEDLRTHTFEKHQNERIDAIESILRPFWQNEVLRIDIQNLSCTVCEEIIRGWNEMFQHLFDKHNVQFDQAYTRLIPYKLSQDLHCALCDERHTNIHYLDSHMNAHYNNHVCPECGDTFVSLARIKKHLVIHDTGSYPCQYCGKSFSLKKYRDKHVAMIHENAKTYKCFYCTERFVTEYGKHSHTKMHHKDKIKIITCEICGKSFDWRPYYLSHLKKLHFKVRRYQCTYCMKWFTAKHDYKLHVQRHTGSGQHYCEFCNKNFVTGQELRSHQKVHKKDVKNAPKCVQVSN